MSAYITPDLEAARGIGDTFSGDVHWANGFKATFGASNAAAIYYNTGASEWTFDPNDGGGSITTLGFGVAAARNDVILGKIGLGDSPISANFFINFVGSGGNRGAMNFDFTQTGSNISVAGNFKVTSQRTSGTSPQTGLIAGCVKNEDLTGTNTYAGISVSASTLSTQGISQGTHNIIGLDITAGAAGGTHTGGTVNQYGLRIAAMTNYAGVTYTEWGLMTGEDSQINSDKKWIFEGAVGTKGDSYDIFNAATTDIDRFVDAVKTQTWDNDQIDFHVQTSWDDAIDMLFGTTTGTKIATSVSQKIAFHNATPVVQRAGAAQAAVATTAATNITPFGYTTAAQADAIVTLLNEIRAVLVEKGLMKGAA